MRACMSASACMQHSKKLQPNTKMSYNFRFTLTYTHVNTTQGNHTHQQGHVACTRHKQGAAPGRELRRGYEQSACHVKRTSASRVRASHAWVRMPPGLLKWKKHHGPAALPVQLDARASRAWASAACREYRVLERVLQAHKQAKHDLSCSKVCPPALSGRPLLMRRF